MHNSSPKNKQEAYNIYADLMECGNRFSSQGADNEAQQLWNQANEVWDIYFYWDDVE